jgi:hypothetical protein
MNGQRWQTRAAGASHPRRSIQTASTGRRGKARANTTWFFRQLPRLESTDEQHGGGWLGVECEVQDAVQPGRHCGLVRLARSHVSLDPTMKLGVADERPGYGPKFFDYH